MSLNDGLVSFWKLDEALGSTRNDSIGTNHLTDNTGAVKLVSPGKIGNAAGFFDQSSWLKIADNASLSLTGNLTICAWVRLNSTLAIDFPGIASKWGSGTRSYSLRYQRSTINRFTFSASTDGTAQTHVLADTFGAPSTATWIFLYAFVDIDNDIVGISVNDGAVDTTAFTGTPFDSTADFEIGRLGTSNNIFEGDIDAVGLWSRRLTSGEVTQLYGSGTGLEPPFPNDQEPGTGIPYFGGGHSPYRVARRVSSY